MYKIAGGMFVIAFAVALSACNSSAQSFVIGRSASGRLVYDGVLTDVGVRSAVQQLTANDTVAVTSASGSTDAAIRFSKALNQSGTTLRVNGSCFGACASGLALGTERVVVPEGATLLFDLRSLREAGARTNNPGGRRALYNCVSALSASEKNNMIWFAPGLLRSLGVTNIDFQWTLSDRARSNFEQIMGLNVTWLDTIEACSAR